VTPVERALCIVAGIIVAFASSWATDREQRRYKRPVLAVLWNVGATGACVYGAIEKGAGSWWGLLCAAGALLGAKFAIMAAGDWLATRDVKPSRKAGGK
jgi:hypothetical protein